MKYLKTYKQVNEGLRDKMTGVSEDDIRDKIQKNPNDMLRVIINYKSDELPSDLVNYIPIQKLTTPNKNILLKYASRLGNAKVVKELLGDSEVNPNTSNGMPIIFACKHGHIDIIKLLLDTGRVDPFDNLNIFLHSLDNLEVINLLLDWIEENGLEQKKLDHLLRKVIHNTRYNSISVRLLALGARFIVTELVRDDVINKPVDFLKLFVNVYNYDVEVIKKEKIDSNYYFTFSIKEKKLNEGLRDKMLPKSEEEILSQYNKLTTEKKFDLLKKIDLDRSLYPPKEEIEKYLSKFDGENRIRCIFELKLYDYLPIKDGYYYIDDNLGLDLAEITKLPDNLHIKRNLFCSETEIRELPRNLIVGESLYCQHGVLEFIPDDINVGKNIILIVNNIKELPTNLTVNGNLDVAFNSIRELPRGLVVKNKLYCEENKLKTLPDDLIVGDVLYAVGNDIKHNVEKPTGVNKIDVATRRF